MAIGTTSPLTRRAILLGTLGGVAASVATAVGRASSVDAANGDFVKVGHTYSATHPTTINATGHFVDALVGTSRSGKGVFGQSSSSIGVWGNSYSQTQPGVWGSNESGPGVVGTSSASNGVQGQSDSAYGVYGQSGSSVGVYGNSNAPDQPAMVGRSWGNSTGVMGYSGSTLPAAPVKTGVFGSANEDASAIGVKGQSVLGTGGHFVSGTSGIALRAIGRVKFDKAAGVATIPAAANKVTVTPGTDLTATSAVVATLQGIPSGTALVKSVAVNPTANTFTIYLTANATHATKVAWHVFG